MGKIQSKLNKIPLIGKIIILLLFIITIILIYSESLSTTLKQNYLNQLIETANYNNSIIHGELKDKQTTLQQIASFIEDSPNMVSRENMQKLSEISKQINLKRIGIIYPDKRVFITDNLGEQSIYIDDIDVIFEKSLRNQESITRIENDKIDNSGPIIVMSIPLKNSSGEFKGVLFATYDVNTLRNFMTLDEILKQINKAENIVILTHESPDGDAVGSSLAMKLIIEEIGKNADVIIPEYSRLFNFLPAANEIKTDSEIKEYDLAIGVDCMFIWPCIRVADVGRCLL